MLRYIVKQQSLLRVRDQSMDSSSNHPPFPVGTRTTTSSLVLLLILITSHLLLFFPNATNAEKFPIQEATIREIQLAFQRNKLTSIKLVKTYINGINKLNPTLRSVIEVNPDALAQAKKADDERRSWREKAASWVNCGSSTRLMAQLLAPSLGPLHGIPVLLKDNIGTDDKLNTTCGSYALMGSKVARDAGVAKKLRSAGAIVLGKSSLSEWCHLRSFSAPNGWSARIGQGLNPYNTSTDTCGSSSGSAISVAANMVAVSLGTETDSSILCPANNNGVVGFKPTVGLTSRSGVIPVSPRQDTIGPICRTVEDAVHVLDVIVGFDSYDANATREALKYIPKGGYAQFLNPDGLRGKRIGIVRTPFCNFPEGSAKGPAFKNHLQALRQRGAVLIDDLEIPNLDSIMDYQSSGEALAMMVEFKDGLRSYLEGLVSTPVRSLEDVIAFNNKHESLEKMKEYGQDGFLIAESTDLTVDDDEVKKAVENLENLSRNGFEKIMNQNNLDAILTPGSDFAIVLAIGGYPGITIPAGYDHDGQPFGVCFGGLKGYEPRLIEIAYSFEQATRIRKPPPPLSHHALM